MTPFTRDLRERPRITLRNVKGAWIKEQEVRLDGDQIRPYKVVMVVTFILE